MTRDKETGAPARRHRVSPITGMYKGKQIIDVAKKALKKEKAKAAKKKEAPKVEEVKKPTKKVANKKEVKK